MTENTISYKKTKLYLKPTNHKAQFDTGTPLNSRNISLVQDHFIMAAQLCGSICVHCHNLIKIHF